MYIQQIGNQYYIINAAGLIEKEFLTLAAAELYLQEEMA
jgi:hypothetical protein